MQGGHDLWATRREVDPGFIRKRCVMNRYGSKAVDNVGQKGIGIKTFGRDSKGEYNGLV